MCALQYGIRPEYEEVPDEAFRVIVCEEEKLQGIIGVAHERPEFATAMWTAACGWVGRRSRRVLATLQDAARGSNSSLRPSA